MQFDPSSAQEKFLAALRDWLATEVAPHAVQWDRDAAVPHEAARALGALGAFGIATAQADGGRGLDAVSLVLAIEEVASHCPSLAVTLAANNGPYGQALARFGTPAQRQEFLAPVAAGRAHGAFAFLESDAGCHLADHAARALPADGGYRLEGEKVMVANAGIAEFVVTVATTNPEAGIDALTAFVLPLDLPGVRRGERAAGLGLRSADLRSLAFDGVRLGAQHRLGREGGGLEVAAAAGNGGNLVLAALTAGIARGAYERTLAEARRVRASGHAAHEDPAIQELLANMVTDTDTARLVTLWAAQLADAGDAGFRAAAARALLAASESTERVTAAALQVFGAVGFLAETGLERFYRDAPAADQLGNSREALRQFLSTSLAEA